MTTGEALPSLHLGFVLSGDWTAAPLRRHPARQDTLFPTGASPGADNQFASGAEAERMTGARVSRRFLLRGSVTLATCNSDVLPRPPAIAPSPHSAERAEAAGEKSPGEV